MRSREEIHRILSNHLPATEVDHLIPWILPALRIEFSGTQDLPLGASHFAGPADLPPDFLWPSARISKRNKKTRPLALLAQINCADLPQGWLDELPTSGWLLFFLDPFDLVFGGHDEQPDRFRVIYLYSYQTLVRQFPTGLPEDQPTVAHPITFHPVWTYDSEPARNDIPVDRYESWRPALEALNLEQSQSHQLLGAPWPIQSRPGFVCEPYERPKGIADLPRVNAINRPAERDKRWRLLLQLQHNDELNWRFGDCGTTYFMVRDTDLAAGRYDQAIPEMQCY